MITEHSSGPPGLETETADGFLLCNPIYPPKGLKEPQCRCIIKDVKWHLAVKKKGRMWYKCDWTGHQLRSQGLTFLYCNFNFCDINLLFDHSCYCIYYVPYIWLELLSIYLVNLASFIPETLLENILMPKPENFNCLPACLPQSYKTHHLHLHFTNSRSFSSCKDLLLLQSTSTSIVTCPKCRLCYSMALNIYTILALQHEPLQWNLCFKETLELIKCLLIIKVSWFSSSVTCKWIL